jgi:hypothetical protein
MNEAYRGYHDMGGLAAGEIDRHEHANALWEKRVDALLVLLSGPDRRLLRVDELRRAIESLGAEAYDAMSYYERWVVSLAHSLIQRGVVTSAEIARKMLEVEKRDPA